MSLHLERKIYRYKEIGPSLLKTYRDDLAWWLKQARNSKPDGRMRAFFIGKAQGFGLALYYATVSARYMTKMILPKGPEDEEEEEDEDEEAVWSFLPKKR